MLARMADVPKLVLKPDARVTCPKCEHEFSLQEGFARHALESIEAASADELAHLREQERASSDKRAQQREREQQELQKQAVEEARRQTLQQARLASDQAQQASSQQLEALQQQFTAAQQQLSQLRAAELALREERQKLKDEKDALALEVRRQVDTKLAERELQVRTQEQERAALGNAELQKKLDDMTAQMAEMQRRAEQGSQQLQGEVLELALEEALRRAFPLDIVDEVKKGQRGGDVKHHVHARSGTRAGLLLWETKRASVWNTQWLAKLKDDMREAGADVGVLITTGTAIPKEWASGTQFGLVDGVWVAVWSVAVQLGEALRAGLLDMHKQRLVSAGKGEKMEAVYDYVTSAQFAQKLKAVLEAFQRMSAELEAEKNQTMQRWARREKQLEAGKAALLGVGGELQGLAQQDLPQLELQPDLLTEP
jgi:hypothetical protein